MNMNKSGKAVRGLLAALYESVGMTPADRSAALLLVRGQAGGHTGKAAVRELIEAGRVASRRVVELERDLEHAQVTIRAMVGQPLPHDRRDVADPPAGHEWVTYVHGPTPDSIGRLWCTTCSADPDYGQGGTVLAAECLERSR